MGPSRVRRSARLVVPIVFGLPLWATAQQPVQMRPVTFLEEGHTVVSTRTAPRLSFMISLGLSLVILGCTSPARESEPLPRQTSVADTGAAAATSPAPLQLADATLTAEAQPNDAASAGSTDPVERRQPDIDPVVLTAVRTGRQERFDRIVFEFSGQTLPGYRVAYASRPVVQCGSGEAIAVAGINMLQVVLTPAQAHTDAGTPTVTPRRWQPGFPVLKDVQLSCDFEGNVAWILGLTTQAAFRISELSNPTRLVIDIRR